MRGPSKGSSVFDLRHGGVDIGEAHAKWVIQLAQRVSSLFEEWSDLSGIVITHGTDSLEETAFLLDLLVPPGKPVVFAAAQRPPRDTDTDGPRNLLNAIRIAALPEAGGLGVLVTLNDEIHAARDVRKTHAVCAERVRLPPGPVPSDRWTRGAPISSTGRRGISPSPLRASNPGWISSRSTPEVTAAGSAMPSRQGRKVSWWKYSGAGTFRRKRLAAVAEAREKGVVVAFRSRTGGGRVEIGEEAKQVGVLSAEDLDGLKARIVLVVALGAGANAERIAGFYRTLSGQIGGLESN